MKFLTGLVLTLVITNVFAQEWISPCPSLFEYDPAGPKDDNWEGTITLKTDQDLSGIWLRLVLDRPPIEIATSFGEAVQRESTEYLIRNPDKGLKIGETQQIRITVRYNKEEPAPRLVGFRLNARVVCPEDGILNKDGSRPPAPPKPTTIAPSNTFPSPCPDVFTYEPLNDNDKWFGVVNVKSDTPLTGVWIRIILDRESLQLGNWFGEVTTGDNKEYVIRNEKIRISPGTETPVRFFIKFKPGTPIPKVVEIRLNQKSICQANVVILPPGGSNNGQQFPGQISGFPNFPGSRPGDNKDDFPSDFGSKPILSPNIPIRPNRPEYQNQNPSVGSPDYPFINDPDFISDDKIIVFPKFYYIIQKFPHFTVIHIKRRNQGTNIGIGNFQIPVVV